MPAASRRRKKAVFLAALLLVLLGALVALVMLYKPYTPPRFLPLVPYENEYAAGMPTRPWARQDIDALLGVGWSGSARTQTSQTRELIVGELRGLAAGSASTPLVVYLGGYVVRGPDGTPYLLPVRGQADDPASMIAFDEVLAGISRSPARHKLVLLDVMFPLVLPEAGLLPSDVAGLIWPSLERAVANDTRLNILCACSPGQTSHASEELGQSAFAYFVHRALSGMADGSGSGRADGRVKMSELAGYVCQHVDAWVHLNLKRRQTPVLLGSGSDFPIVQAAAEPVPPADAPGESDYPQWLMNGWRTLDGWWDEGVHRVYPDGTALYRDVAQVLVRAQQRWRAGVEKERVESDLMEWRRKQKRRYDDLPPRSPGGPVPLARHLWTDESENKSFTLRAILRARADGKPNEVVEKQLMASVEEVKKAYKDRPLPLAALICDTLASLPVSAEGVKQLDELLLLAPEAEAYAEVKFVKALARRARARPADWSAEVARLAMDAVQKAARIRAARPEPLLWVEDKLQAATRQRQEGEQLLFQTSRPWADTARKLYLDLEEKYKEVLHDLNTADEAMRYRDENLALLPGYLEAPDLDARQLRALRGAVSTTRSLASLLENPSGRRADRLRDLVTLNQAAETDRARLPFWWRPEHQAAFKEVLERTLRGRFAEANAMTLLASPWVHHRQRRELWDSYRAGSQGRHRDSLEVVDRRDEVRGRLPNLPFWSGGAAAAGQTSLRQEDLTRAQASLLRLQLLTNEDYKDTEVLISHLGKKLDDQPAWDKLAESLRRAWRNPGLPRQP